MKSPTETKKKTLKFSKNKVKIKQKYAMASFTQ